jgi:Flp pilus assembly protein TadB
MIPTSQKTQTEKTIELIGFVFAAIVFLAILYFVVNKLTHNLQITRIILAIIVLGLFLVNWINRRYKKWVW